MKLLHTIRPAPNQLAFLASGMVVHHDYDKP
jgi:hypothetical protein